MKKTTYLIKTFGIASILFFVSFSPFAIADEENISVVYSFFGPNWDVNHNGKADYMDASMIVSTYGSTGTPDRIHFREDTDRDGDVDYHDASYFVSHYGERWLVFE